MFLTVGDEAHIKVFTLAIPPTPKESTTHPSFPSSYNASPTPLTHSHAASAVQPLPNGRLIYSQSSFTSPNDVFIIRGLTSPSSTISSAQTKGAALSKLEYAQVTRFTADSLKSKDLDAGESFWFKGAEGKQVQGWALKPKGWKEGAKKAFPVVLLIHGGPQGAWEDQWSTRWNPNSSLIDDRLKITAEIVITFSIHATRLLHDCNQSDWINNIRTKFVVHSLL